MEENKNPARFDSTAHYFQHKFIKTKEDKLFELTKAALTGVLSNPSYAVKEKRLVEIAIKSAKETLKQLNENKI